MSYNYFFKFIPKDEIKIIFEIGANDGSDSCIIYNHYKPEQYHLFEPNIGKKEILENRLKKYNININYKAIYDKLGHTDFYICKSNSGASSMLGKVKKEFCKIADKECNMPLEQHIKRLNEYCNDIDWEKTQVSTITLFDYCSECNIQYIDLICMDVEGVGLTVLKSLKEKIKNVKYIISECDYGLTRENEETFKDINNYLIENGFTMVENKFQVSILSDCLWVNTSRLINN
jgi:FkbM family methyltransferase